MSQNTITLLLIENNDEYAKRLSQTLQAIDATTYAVSHIKQLNTVKKSLDDNAVDVILLNLSFLTQKGISKFISLHPALNQLPIIVLAAEQEKEFALKTVADGAQDYVTFEQINSELLDHSIQLAITRKRNENALAEGLKLIAQENQEWEVTIDSLPQLICLIDKTNSIIRANKTVEQWGLGTATEAKGNNLHDVFHPNCDEPDCSLKQILNEALDQLGEGNFTEYEWHNTKTKRYFHWQFRPAFAPTDQSESEQEHFAIINVQDITKSKQAETEINNHLNQLFTLQQIDAELMQTLDVDYVLSLALDAATRLSGADAGFIGLVEGQHVGLAQLIGPYPDQFTEANLNTGIVKRVISNQRAELVLDVTQDTDYVENIPAIKAQLSIPLVSQDRLVGILNLETHNPERFTQEVFEFIQLITARIAIAVDNAQLYNISQTQLTELRHLYAQVSSLEQLKTDMIRIASHDLRNPLGIILIYVDTLEKALWENLNDRQQLQFQRIQDAAKRMQKIITDILSLERIEASQDNQVNIDLRELVDRAYTERESQAQHKEQTYSLIAPDDPVIIRGDSAQLYEAIDNLIGNAIKYTPESGLVEINLSTADTTVKLTVRDTGFGIPEDQQERLFQPFYRAYSDETANIEGTGLGLYLVKNIIERHNGTMQFSSTYGEGSTFGFEVPLSE